MTLVQSIHIRIMVILALNCVCVRVCAVCWQLEREYLSLFSSVYDRELQELVGGSTGARTHLLALQHAEHYEVRSSHTDPSGLVGGLGVGMSRGIGSSSGA